MSGPSMDEATIVAAGAPGDHATDGDAETATVAPSDVVASLAAHLRGVAARDVRLARRWAMTVARLNERALLLERLARRVESGEAIDLEQLWRWAMRDAESLGSRDLLHVELTYIRAIAPLGADERLEPFL